MTDDEIIARIAVRANEDGRISLHDADILFGAISQLKASNKMAAEHMARGREYSARLETELDALKAPRTEMICLACGGFSSTRFCHACSTIPVITRAVIADLKARITKLEERAWERFGEAP